MRALALYIGIRLLYLQKLQLNSKCFYLEQILHVKLIQSENEIYSMIFGPKEAMQVPLSRKQPKINTNTNKSRQYGKYYKDKRYIHVSG